MEYMTSVKYRCISADQFQSSVRETRCERIRTALNNQFTESYNKITYRIRRRTILEKNNKNAVFLKTLEKLMQFPR